MFQKRVTLMPPYTFFPTQPTVRAAQELVLVGRPESGECRLRVWLFVHAAPAVYQLQAEVGGASALARLRLQGLQHVHRRPVRLHHQHAHGAQVPLKSLLFKDKNEVSLLSLYVFHIDLYIFCRFSYCYKNVFF